jgi:hypothetical protein
MPTNWGKKPKKVWSPEPQNEEIEVTRPNAFDSGAEDDEAANLHDIYENIEEQDSYDEYDDEGPGPTTSDEEESAARKSVKKSGKKTGESTRMYRYGHTLEDLQQIVSGVIPVTGRSAVCIFHAAAGDYEEFASHGITLQVLSSTFSSQNIQLTSTRNNIFERVHDTQKYAAELRIRRSYRIEDINEAIGLSVLLGKLNLAVPRHLHNAGNDAHATMQCVLAMMRRPSGVLPVNKFDGFLVTVDTEWANEDAGFGRPNIKHLTEIGFTVIDYKQVGNSNDPLNFARTFHCIIRENVLRKGFMGFANRDKAAHYDAQRLKFNVGPNAGRSSNRMFGPVRELLVPVDSELVPLALVANWFTNKLTSLVSISSHPYHSVLTFHPRVSISIKRLLVSTPRTCRLNQPSLTSGLLGFAL